MLGFLIILATAAALLDAKTCATRVTGPSLLQTSYAHSLQGTQGARDEQEDEQNLKCISRNLWSRYDQFMSKRQASLLTEGSSWKYPVVVGRKKLCQMLRLATWDLKERNKLGFAGWVGNSSVLKVPYKIDFAGKKGLGLFATAPISSGAHVYDGGPTDATRGSWVVVPKMHMQNVRNVVASFSKEVVAKLMDWCENDFLSQRGLLCELGDEHYINSDSSPNIGPCKVGMCALRDIDVGEELLENYENEWLDTATSNSWKKSIIEYSGNTFATKMC